MIHAILDERSTLPLTLGAMARRFHAAWEARSAARRDRRRVARELDTFNERELGELGFSRADLRDIVSGGYRR
jgi:hypothetical protein